MAVIGSTQVNSSPFDGKYTQGFVFEHGQHDRGYARAVVERSCVAVLTLLQDVFAVAEKTAFQQAIDQVSIRDQNRAFRRLADIIRHRPLLEKSLVTAVTCAYAEMISAGSSGIDASSIAANTAQIEKRVSELKKMRCERLDIVSLFDVDSIRDHTNDCTRPLLLDLSAQLTFLFGGEVKHISCNPLSPATLMGGFMAGLICADMDILAKRIMFHTFKQEFLSKLSVLMNSVTLRLERENLFAKRAVGFDDKNAGPIAHVLINPSALSLAALSQGVNKLHTSLTPCRDLGLAKALYALSGEESMDSIVQLLSDVRYHYDDMEPVVLRATTNAVETSTLVDARRVIAERLNTVFSGKRMPVAIKDFLANLWPDVLFDIFVVSGEASEIWQDAMKLQHELLESVTPVQDSEKLTMLNRSIPGVVRTLRRTLDETGCSFEEMATFLGELKLLHLQNVQQKLDVETFIVWKELSRESNTLVAQPILSEDESVCYGQMKEMISLLAYR